MAIAQIRPLFVTIALLISACSNNSNDVDLSGIKSDVQLKRFERDLVVALNDSGLNGMQNLKHNYGEFMNVFTHHVLSIPDSTDEFEARELRNFISDPEIRKVFEDVSEQYPDVTGIKNDLDLFLRYHQHYFPGQVVPGMVTYVSAFNYAVITTDSVIGISLDMFLGSDSEYYPRLGIPKYMSDNFRREYIVPSVIKAWFQSEYDPAAVKREFLSQMVYYGKLFYYMDAMAPSLPDSVKTGFKQAQLDWCRENENRIWAFFIEKKLLFSTDASEYARFINDGPSSNGFPADAPARIGAWIGWQIVREYMIKNNQITLTELLMETDALKILEASGYKPKR